MLKNYIKKIQLIGYNVDIQIIKQENLHMIVVIIFFVMKDVKDMIFMETKNNKKYLEKILIKIL